MHVDDYHRQHVRGNDVITPKRLCREQRYLRWVMKRIGVLDVDDPWKWRQAMIQADCFSDREICDHFKEPWNKTIRLIAKDKAKMKPREEGWRLLMWKIGNSDYHKYSFQNFIRGVIA